MSYPEIVGILKDRVPLGKAFIGCCNSSGWKVFLGYVYTSKEYGVFEFLNYKGSRVIVIIDNGTIKTV